MILSPSSVLNSQISPSKLFIVLIAQIDHVKIATRKVDNSLTRDLLRILGFRITHGFTKYLWTDCRYNTLVTLLKENEASFCFVLPKTCRDPVNPNFSQIHSRRLELEMLKGLSKSYRPYSNYCWQDFNMFVWDHCLIWILFYFHWSTALPDNTIFVSRTSFQVT